MDIDVTVPKNEIVGWKLCKMSLWDSSLCMRYFYDEERNLLHQRRLLFRCPRCPWPKDGCEKEVASIHRGSDGILYSTPISMEEEIHFSTTLAIRWNIISTKRERELLLMWVFGVSSVKVAMRMKDLGTQTQQGYVRMKYVLTMEIVKPTTGYAIKLLWVMIE